MLIQIMFSSVPVILWVWNILKCSVKSEMVDKIVILNKDGQGLFWRSNQMQTMKSSSRIIDLCVPYRAHFEHNKFEPSELERNFFRAHTEPSENRAKFFSSISSTSALRAGKFSSEPSGFSSERCSYPTLHLIRIVAAIIWLSWKLFLLPDSF